MDLNISYPFWIDQQQNLGRGENDLVNKKIRRLKKMYVCAKEDDNQDRKTFESNVKGQLNDKLDQ